MRPISSTTKNKYDTNNTAASNNNWVEHMLLSQLKVTTGLSRLVGQRDDTFLGHAVKIRQHNSFLQSTHALIYNNN